MIRFTDWLDKRINEDFTDDYASLHYLDYKDLLNRMAKYSPQMAEKAEAARKKNPTSLERIKNFLIKHIAEIESGIPSEKLPPLNTVDNMDNLPTNTLSPSDVPSTVGNDGASVPSVQKYDPTGQVNLRKSPLASRQ